MPLNVPRNLVGLFVRPVMPATDTSYTTVSTSGVLGALSPCQSKSESSTTHFGVALFSTLPMRK
jgi:hypothetical protein